MTISGGFLSRDRRGPGRCEPTSMTASQRAAPVVAGYDVPGFRTVMTQLRAA